MNIILLSGGSGTRLWPLSNEVRSKQFLKIFRRADGVRESMVQRMYRMLKAVDPAADITIATSDSQIPQIEAQLGKQVRVSVEPCRRDTFPAIALAAACLKRSGVGRDAPVVVCSVDPYVDIEFFRCLKRMSDAVQAANLTLMGIEPTEPSEAYGYIIPGGSGPIAPVRAFREKPDARAAGEYIAQGALWNAGVFAFRLGYVLDIARELLGADDYDALCADYESFQRISFDYAVVERETDINVVRFSGQWKDLGSWSTLTEAMQDPVNGRAVAAACENTHVINELGIPLVALGVRDSVIVATPDGILVSDKEKSARLKEYVAAQRPMYERRVWGEYKVLDYKIHEDGNNSLVKELILDAGKHISYQIHRRRTEIWTFTEGVGRLVLDGVAREVRRGDMAVIPPGTRHALLAVSQLHIIEVQIGDELTEDDIERFDFDWDQGAFPDPGHGKTEPVDTGG